MKLLKYTISIFAIFLFLHSHSAFAAVIKDATSNTGGSENPACTTNGGTDWCKAGIWPGTINFSPATNFSSINKLSSVTVSVTAEPYSVSNCSTNCWFKMVIFDGNNNSHVSNNQFVYSDVSISGYTQLKFNFDLNNTIDFTANGNGGKLDHIGWTSGNGNYFTRPGLSYQFSINTFSGFNLPPCASGNPTTCPSNVAPWLKIEDTGATFSITNPLNGSTATASPSFQISGTCPNNGTNKLGYSPDITQLDLFPVQYNISCTNNLFSFTKNITGGSHQIYVVDSTDNNFVHVSFTATDDPNVQITTPNKLTLIYPPSDNPNHYTVHPATQFPLRFKYQLQDKNVYNTAVFRMSDCTDITFVSCTLGANFYVKNQDTRPNGNFDVNVAVVNGQDYFYSATLYDTYPSSTWSYTLNFVLHGDSASTVLPNAGDTGGNCTNFLCDLFIPSNDFWETFSSDAQASLGDKVPFYYYYQLRSSYTGVSTSPQDTYFINTTLTSVDKNGNTLVSVPFQLLNTADTRNKNIFNTFRPYISAGIWLMFGFYLFTRTFRVFHSA